MKKISLGQLAVLGITSGLFTVSQGIVLADANTFDMSHVIAKPKCGEAGCAGGKIAMRDDVTDPDPDKEIDTDVENKEIEAEDQLLDENEKKRLQTNTRTQSR